MSLHCNARSFIMTLSRCVTVKHIFPKNMLAKSRIAGVVSTVSDRNGRLQHFHHSSAEYQTRFRGFSIAEPPMQFDLKRLSTQTDSDYPQLPDYDCNLEHKQKDVFIVRAKGLPWSCTAEDLLNFFSECRIHDGVNGIHLTQNKDGRPAGQAFIELEDEEDVRKALAKNRQYIGTRYIEVNEVTDIDAEAILNKSVELPAKDGVVRIRGLPYTCSEREVVLFFSGLDIVEDGVTIVTTASGRHTGTAYVQFASQEMADSALQRDRELIGHRYIEVFPSSTREIKSQHVNRREDVPAVPAKNFRSEAAAQPPPQRSDDRPGRRTSPFGKTPAPVQLGHYIHMRGLPYQAAAEEIVTFFFPLRLVKIVMEYGPDGRSNGEADVYFSCHEDAVSAMTRDKAYLQNRYIELFLNSPRQYVTQDEE